MKPIGVISEVELSALSQAKKAFILEGVITDTFERVKIVGIPPDKIAVITPKRSLPIELFLMMYPQIRILLIRKEVFSDSEEIKAKMQEFEVLKAVFGEFDLSFKQKTEKEEKQRRKIVKPTLSVLYPVALIKKNPLIKKEFEELFGQLVTTFGIFRANIELIPLNKKEISINMECTATNEIDKEKLEKILKNFLKKKFKTNLKELSLKSAVVRGVLPNEKQIIVTARPLKTDDIEKLREKRDKMKKMGVKTEEIKKEVEKVMSLLEGFDIESLKEEEEDTSGYLTLVSESLRDKIKELAKEKELLTSEDDIDAAVFRKEDGYHVFVFFPETSKEDHDSIIRELVIPALAKTKINWLTSKLAFVGVITKRG